jgi:hypothetical protein
LILPTRKNSRENPEKSTAFQGPLSRIKGVVPKNPDRLSLNMQDIESEFSHTPVLLEETMAILRPKVADCSSMRRSAWGGHSEAISQILE